ncbi:ATP-binding protein [Arcanobacterium hippocoleae]
MKLLSETLIQVNEEPELVRKFAGKLEEESARLSDLVQEIIQLSRLQETDALSDPQVVSIDGVVNEALERMDVEAKAHKIHLSRGGERGLEVYGDYSLLVTAVRNLLDNAIRYSKSHSRVSVGVSSANDTVSIAVVDAGQGIPEEIQGRVFERFFRGDAARSRDTGGTGLGLSIVKHVVQDHGGKVRLWSEEGRGSTFTIVLPKAYEQLRQQAGKSQSADSGDEAGAAAISLTQTAESQQEEADGTID